MNHNRSWLTIALMLGLVALAEGQGWEWQNPLPNGNTMEDVVFVSADLGWAVGNNGTILHSTDAGLSWSIQHSASNILLQGVDFVDANHGWVGGFNLQNLSAVLWRTQDGGVTWAPQNLPVPAYVEDVDFVDLNHGWCIGSGWVFGTVNGGQTWFVQLDNVNYGMRRLACVDSLHSWMCGYDYLSDQALVTRTSDGGQTWEALETNVDVMLYCVAFADTMNGCAGGENGAILHTSDGGTTWETQSIGVYSAVEGISMLDANRAIAATLMGQVLSTTNGGLNWSTLWETDQHDYFLNVFFSDAQHGSVSGYGGLVFSTQNGGASWTSWNTGVRRWLRGISFGDDSTGYAIGSYATILKTTDAGAAWSALPPDSTLYLTDVHFANRDTGWVVGGQEGETTWMNYIAHTTDGGHTWTVAEVGVQGFVNALCFVNDHEAWAVGDTGVIWHSVDGLHWDPQLSNTLLDLTGVSFADSVNGWATAATYNAGYTGGILRTTDAGETWGMEYGPGEYYFTDACFVNAQTGWVTGYNPTNGRAILWRTTNGGSSWTGQNHGGAFELEDVSFAGSASGWACGAYGALLHTSNGGGTWLRDTSGTGNDLYAVSMSSSGHVWVVGVGGTILRGSYSLSVPDERPPLPFGFSLSAYPNPFNSSTRLSYELPVTGKVNLALFDLTGRLVRTLEDRITPQGRHTLIFDGSGLSSGMYFVRLQTSSLSTTKKLLLMK